MRSRATPVEIVLLAVFGLFLVYPIFYVIPGSASEVEFAVRLKSLGGAPEERAAVVAILAQNAPDFGAVVPVQLPYTVRSFPASFKADELAGQLRKAGAEVEIARQRHWTSYYFRQALGFAFEGQSEFPYLTLIPNNPFLWECLRNSLVLALASTAVTTLLCLPLAYWFTRFRFVGQTGLASLLLVPLILPPFVGAIGMERFLGRFGTFNLWLMQLGVLQPGAPIDWLGEGGFFGVMLMQVLHLYPILYLNLAAAWSNVDPTLEDAARNLGAGELHVFRTITFPLLLPGYFAGATLVFVWAFTDLGTPLVFGVESVIPVQIFNQVSDPQRTNSTAYALVVITLFVTAALFYAARWLVNRSAYVGGGKGAVAQAVPPAGRGLSWIIVVVVVLLTLAALLPSIGVVLAAFTERWSFTPLPQAYTTQYIRDVWSNRVAAISIRNSVIFSACSTFFDIVIGVTIAWLVARRPSKLTGLLDGLATLPLALPGLVLAFGYLTCYSNWDFGLGSDFLNPVKNPVPLLIIAYSIRRLPYLTRSALAGLQQIAPVMEEAAENLGASRWRVVRTITIPLIAAHILAGAVLTFAFALLEVSDSLMLAREEKYFPITRAILGLLMRPDDGDSIASALAVFAMGLLSLSLLIASLVLGKKMGELFRA